MLRLKDMFDCNHKLHNFVVLAAVRHAYAYVRRTYTRWGSHVHPAEGSVSQRCDIGVLPYVHRNMKAQTASDGIKNVQE